MSPAVSSSLVALLWLLTTAFLLLRWRTLQGTTLRPALVWAIVAVGAVSGVELLAARWEIPANLASHLRYCAACLTFCPLMATLGAKRPQDKAWQFVVFTLWIVLALASGEILLDRPDAPLTLHAARQWFLLLLIGLGLTTSLPTRHWLSSLLAAAGQWLLLGGQLPEWISPPHGMQNGSLATMIGFILLSSSCMYWGLDLPRRGTSLPECDGQHWNRVWRDFRDSFGTLWALRVKERFNADAQLCSWPARLDWHGLHRVPEGNDSAELQAAMEQDLRMLLRRFVSAEWIDERLKQP